MSEVLFLTDRLQCVSAEEADIPEIMEIEHDPENSKYIFTGEFAEHRGEIEREDVLLIAIRPKGERRLVGYVIIDLDFESDWFEIRRIAFSEKNQGYGRETLDGLLRYAFEERKVNKVWLEAYADNKVGRHLYESMGFHIDGVLRQHHREERGLMDQVQYSMLQGEYWEEYAKRKRV